MYRWPITHAVNSDILHLHWSQHEKANRPSLFTCPETAVIWYSRLILTESCSSTDQPIHVYIYLCIRSNRTSSFITVRVSLSSLQAFVQQAQPTHSGLKCATTWIPRRNKMLTRWTKTRRWKTNWNLETSKWSLYCQPVIIQFDQIIAVRQKEPRLISVSTPSCRELSRPVQPNFCSHNRDRIRTTSLNFLGFTAQDTDHQSCHVSRSLHWHSFRFFFFCFLVKNVPGSVSERHIWPSKLNCLSISIWFVYGLH